MQINSVNRTNFTGIPVAKVKVKGFNSEYKLYDVDRRDMDFLKKMYESVNLDLLMRKMSYDNKFIWKGLLKCAINGAKFPSKKVFIETCDNIPCGILNYSSSPMNFYLNYIVTFPNKPENRVPCAGQILFNELFRRFIPESASYMRLQALHNAPFNPILKYFSLGFKSYGGDEISEAMAIDKKTAKDTFTRQKEFLTTQILENQKNEDLNKTITLLDKRDLMK